MRSDSTRAREELGYRPQRSLREGLEETIAWYRGELDRQPSQFAR
jgi:nucleoside-diphosphate-sugar epimerase